MKILIGVCLLVFFSGAYASAQTENTCWIKAPSMNDVWVIIYQEDRHGNRGEKIWEGKIPARGKIQIKCPSGYIRYQYSEDPDQPYQGDTSAECTENRELLMQ